MRADHTPFRIVIVTMDSYLAHAAEAAEEILRRDIPGLELRVHTADEWGQDPALLDACLADIEHGDIVVAAMLFLEDHIRAVLPALKARRDHCDAMLGVMSAGEVVRLTRLGKFTMDAKAGGGLALLKRLRGSSKEGRPASGQAQMKMLRRLPTLLKFIPGTAQDARIYFLAMQYWLGGSETNLVNMVRLLVDRYATGARQPSPALSAPPRRCSIRMSGFTIPPSRAASRPTSRSCHAVASAAPSAFCCCAPTCSPAMPRITKASSRRWRPRACG